MNRRTLWRSTNSNYPLVARKNTFNGASVGKLWTCILASFLLLFGSFLTFVVGKKTVHSSWYRLVACATYWLSFYQAETTDHSEHPHFLLLSPALYAEHDSIWYGISLGSVGVSCLVCVHSQHLVHPQSASDLSRSHLTDRSANLLMFEIKRQVQLLNAEGKSFLQGSLKLFWAPQPPNLPLILALLMSCLSGMIGR